jgi:hypothetical protein
MNTSTDKISAYDFLLSSDLSDENTSTNEFFFSLSDYHLHSSHKRTPNTPPFISNDYFDYSSLPVLVKFGTIVLTKRCVRLDKTYVCTNKIDESYIAHSRWIDAVDLDQVKKIIFNFNNRLKSTQNQLPYQHLGWPLLQDATSPTDINISPSIKLDDAAIQFINERELTEGVLWLQEVAPKYYEGSDFEINALQNEDGDDNMLALKVYGAFSVADFRRIRHSICAEMLAVGYKTLYDVISIFQRRIEGSGWKTLSWYGTISEK